MTNTPDAPISDLVSTVIDYRGKTPKKSDTGIPLITAKVIKDGRITNSRAEFIPTDSYSSWMRRGLPEVRDILVTTEAPLGEVAQITTTDRVALAQRVILLRPNPAQVEPQFLFHFLRSPEGRARMQERSSGTTVSGIRQPELLAVRVPLLDRRQQATAAALLDALDDLIATNERRIELLEDLARSLYREWFARFRFPGQPADAGRPADWSEQRLGEIAAVVSDGIDPSEVAADTPYCGLEHLPRRSTTLRDWASVDSVSSRKLRFQEGDTLFGKIRPYFHKVAWSPFDGVTSSDAMVFRPTGPISAPALLATILASDEVVVNRKRKVQSFPEANSAEVGRTRRP